MREKFSKEKGREWVREGEPLSRECRIGS
ncbi:hypothetical protein CCACVL1_27442, partial [Corchorus capsularis]